MRIDDRALLAIYEANSIENLAQTVFSVLNQHLPLRGASLVPWPLDSPKSIIVSEPELQQGSDNYWHQYNRYDPLFHSWLKLDASPPVLKGSELVSQQQFVSSQAFSQVYEPHGIRHIASIELTDKKHNRLNTVTLFRSEEHGDLTANEVALLERLQPHLLLAVRRLACSQQDKLTCLSLQKFARTLPIGAIVTDWNLEPLYYNQTAKQICQEFIIGKDKASQLSVIAPQQLPVAIVLYLLEFQYQIKKLYSLKLQRHCLRLDRKWQVDLFERKLVFSFIPAPSPSIFRGYFLIRINPRHALSHSNPTALELFSLLSPAECSIAKEILKGYSNLEIANRLGKSPYTVRNQITAILDKLRVNSRSRLMRLIKEAHADRDFKKHFVNIQEQEA